MSQFPASGELSMATVASGLGVATNVPYSMNDFRNKTLYNTDGSTYQTPSTGEISIQYFYGRYYTDPYIPDITTYYEIGTTTIVPPSGQLHNPISFTVTLWGAGGGGGGGGSGHAGAFYNGGGGGGGGGGSGGNINISSKPYYDNIPIQCSIGGGGPGAGGGSEDAGPGTSGGDTIISYGTYFNETATGGAGGGGGRWGANGSGEQGGPGGGGGTGGTNGQDGIGGQTGTYTGIASDTGVANGGSGGTGISVGPDIFATGGGGGNGGWAKIGYQSTDGEPGVGGSDGIIKVIWTYQ